MKIALLAVSFFLATGAGADADPQTTDNTQPGDKLPNVVFFLVDDLGWRDVGCFGSSFYETPHIDRLATEGVRFTQAYAACHVCSPTRASILTGKYPARLHMTDWLPGRREFPFQRFKNAEIHQHLPFAEVTLAEALKAQGYSTAIFGKWHLGEEPSGPLAHGFDVQVPRWNKGWPRTGYHAPFRLDGLKDTKGDYLTDRLTDEALKYIEQKKDKPFFLYLSHYAVHDPIQGRADLVEKYRRKLERVKRPQSPAFVLEGNPDSPDPLSREQRDFLIRQPSHQDFRVLPRQTVKIKQHQDNIQFAAMVEAMDESLGRVQAKLKTLGLEENTIVIFFSDNGGMSAANFGNPKRVIPPSKLDLAYSTSNLPLRGAKGWLYEGGIRVPMIVKWPGRGNQGTVCEVPVISTDFYPAILEMAGLPARPAQHADGLSFVPALTGKPFQGKAIYWHFPHYSNHGMQSPGGAIRQGDFKLLEYFENDSIQLFNLKKDPGEQHDIARSQPKTAAALLAKLHAWRKTVNARMMQAK
ncbi:MAG: sulfatase [Planctomycetaceae bacterium]|jgi:arylsulfatase A|nr:sulfatase [Planctomycetaceae bacterium]MBT6486267.1 sulfatase [Planctomycetaceae bacterium]MBT6498227.1 sulfatase [Planctomycetaceae bacterium]